MFLLTSNGKYALFTSQSAALGHWLVCGSWHEGPMSSSIIVANLMYNQTDECLHSHEDPCACHAPSVAAVTVRISAELETRITLGAGENTPNLAIVFHVTRCAEV